MNTVEASIDIQQHQNSVMAASARARRMVFLLPWAALFRGGKRGRDLCTKSPNHRIRVSFQLEGIFKGHLVQLSCEEQGHLQFDLHLVLTHCKSGSQRSYSGGVCRPGHCRPASAVTVRNREDTFPSSPSSICP